MTAPVDVANLALDQVSARFYITSLDPPLPAPNAAVVARNYQPRLDALSRAAHWNCLRMQADLSLVKAAQGTPENVNGTTLPTPPRPWLYAYVYPSDCLKARYLVANPPQDSGSAIPILGAGTLANPQIFGGAAGYPFAVATDTDSQGNRIRVILTDLQYAQLVYTGRLDNPDLWDPHFLSAAISNLAAWLVSPLTNNSEKLKEQIAIATAIIQQARISDGNEGTTSIDHVPDWMATRGLSGWRGVLDAGQCFYGWDAIGFPGGVVI